MDGPSADILDMQSVDVDMAPDRTAALAYLKRVGGVDHVFVSRLENGAWTGPQRVDAGLDTYPSRNLSIAVANGGKVVVTFLNASIAPGYGERRLGDQAERRGRLRRTDRAALRRWLRRRRRPRPERQRLCSDHHLRHGTGFDVFGKRLEGSTWTPVGADYPSFNDASLDLNSSTGSAGEPGDQRGPRVAVTPDGASAVAAFTEEKNVGEYEVVARRLAGTTRGSAASADVASFGGFNEAASGADMADVDVDAGGTAWVVFREGIDYNGTNHPRTLARALSGSTFGQPFGLDSLPTPPGNDASEFLRVAVTDAGQGVAGSYHQMTFDVDGAILSGRAWGTPFPVSLSSTEGVARTAVALGENGSGLFTWRRDPGPRRTSRSSRGPPSAVWGPSSLCRTRPSALRRGRASRRGPTMVRRPSSPSPRGPRRTRAWWLP